MIVLSGNLFVYFDQSPGLVKGCVLLCLFLLDYVFWFVECVQWLI